MEKKTNKKLIIAIVAIVVAIAALLCVYLIAKPKATAGAKAVTIQVVDNEGLATDYTANTDAEYLSQIFDEIDDLTVSGSVGDYGLYIDTVNGLTADYSVDGAYWAIYVNDEYGQYAADSQPVNDGDAFKLVYEVYAQ